MTLPPEQTDKVALIAELDGLIEQITKDCSKPYFGKRLKQLARENFENAEIICNYILAEKTALSAEIGSRQFYFCSTNCLNTFTNPEKELSKMKKRMYVAVSGALALAIMRAVAYLAQCHGHYRANRY